MNGNVYTGNASVDALAEMNISGNVTPANWYKTILRDNCKPYLLAICILSEIVYWYRPVEVRDEHSGMLKGYRKKFREDMLQKSYNDLAEQFGESKRSVKAAMDRLEEIGVIKKIFLNKTLNNGIVVNNVMYVDLCIEKLYEYTYSQPNQSGGESPAGSTVGYSDDDMEGDVSEIEEKQAETSVNKPVTKFCTPSYKTLYEPPTKFCTTLPQNNVAPPTEFCTTLPQNNVAPPTKFRGTNTENTEETTEENTHHIVPSGERDDVMDEIDEIRQFIKDNMEYDTLIIDHSMEKREIDELVELIVETIAVKQEYIRINKQDFPYAVVRSRFEKIHFDTMEYVLECMRNNTTKAVYENVVLKPSEFQKDVVASLADRAEVVRNGGVDSTVDNMLKITNDGRKLALDQRLINPMLPDDENSKASVCVEKAFAIYEEEKEMKGAQLIFCDLSTPKNDGNFNVYDDIKQKLMSKGVPENEIAFIHDANTETKKADLFAKVRSGDVRFLLGSTAKMGAGTNVQDRLIALHHLEVHWRPSDVGRILRTFKIKKNVEVTDNGKIII